MPRPSPTSPKGITEAMGERDERLPTLGEEVLTYTINSVDTSALAYYDGEDWYNTHGEHIRPHYWLPIPQLNPEKEER